MTARHVPASTHTVPTAAAMRELGRRLGALLRAGDLVVLSGDLGAGKTTLTQGVGEALEVRGRVTSPTFVIARVHPPNGDGPPLVHVDAYRLDGWDELEDLDLEASLDEAVTVVEWGSGLVEGLADDRVEVELHRSRADTVTAPEEVAAAEADIEDAADPRSVTVRAVGARWSGVDLAAVADLPAHR